MKSTFCRVARLGMIAGAALMSIGAAGCSTQEVEESADATEALSGVEVPNPSGSYFAKVTANGSGCPAGTWDAEISGDGQTFTMRFSAYETTLNAGESIAVKDCQLSIKLHSPQGLSYSVSSFYYSGYAFLDQEGMSAAQTAKYYFQGNPVASSENRSDLKGPLDQEYVFSDSIGTGDLVWSSCGVDRDLNVATRVMARNNPGKTGSGYISNTTVDGSVELKFKLAWRSCGEPSSAATTAITRRYRNGDHLYTRDPNEAPHYQLEGQPFLVFDEAQPDTRAIYRCRAGSAHFVSNDVACEGRIAEGLLGWLSSAPGDGLVELVRCRNKRSTDYLATNRDECNGARYVIEGTLGYARQP